MESQLSNALDIKNSLFYGILKIFCHSWLRPKNGHFGLKPLLLGLKSPEKWFLRCNFKIAVAREFSIFFAHNFKSETSDTMFEDFDRTTRTRGGVHPPAIRMLSSFLRISQNMPNYLKSRCTWHKLHLWPFTSRSQSRMYV